MNGFYKNIKKCRICGSGNLTPVLSLGKQYLSSSFVKDNSVEKMSQIKIPLTLLLCDRNRNNLACGLVQLRETVNRDLLYKNYFYRSAINPLMKKALKNIVNEVMEKVEFKKGDHILDIGCNDGTMLSYFPKKTVRIGIDPASNIDRSWLDKSISVETDYFSKEKAIKLSRGSLFKCVTSIAMFYDLDNPISFVNEVKSVLALGGVWCIQLSYLPTSLKTLNFYDICHEHLGYYSLGVISNLMSTQDLKIFDASLNSVNGGSLRVFISHKNDNRPISVGLKKLYAAEKKMGLYSPETYKSFGAKIDNLKEITKDFILSEKKNGGLVTGLGASTKGNVLLQYFGINKKMLSFISERNSEKVGLRTLGTDMELISEERARELNPSAMLVLIWFFKDEIIKRERNYLKNGGKLFFPMPYPHIITKKGENQLDFMYS
ncbi:MAG: class I SAM-dependent methyltransferase [bacterium]|nr:class I SAM-dependent methyltransferase [bacterium]